MAGRTLTLTRTSESGDGHYSGHFPGGGALTSTDEGVGAERGTRSPSVDRRSQELERGALGRCEL
eukprot:3660211-Rhodomonas_salina.3